MSAIKNTIILDDQMSPILDNIIDRTEMLNMMFAATPDYIIEMANTMNDLAGRHAKFIEPFIEMNEQMNKITESTKEQSEAIESITKVSADVTKGMQDITAGALSVMQSVGLISPQFAGAVKGVNQLGRGIAATIPKAAGLKVMLGPISLIATAVAGIIGAVQMFRQTTEDALPGYDDLLTRSREMTRESDRLYQNLRENIRLMERMNEIGASPDLIEYFRMQVESSQQWKRFFGILEFDIQRDLVSAAAQELYDMEIERLGLAANAIEWGQNRIQHVTQLMTQTATDSHDMMSRLNHTLHRYNFGLHDSIISPMRAFNDILDDIDTTRMGELFELIQGDPENRYTGLLKDVQNVVRFVEENHVELGMAVGMGYGHQSLDYAIEAAEAAYAAAAPLIPLYQHLAATYRDVFTAADSLRGAYGALSATRDAMANGTLISIEQFNELMNLHPRYIGYLMEECGALRDVEEAIKAVTAAQMENAAVQQVQALLNMAKYWTDQADAVYDYAAVVKEATGGLWDFVAVQMAVLKTTHGMYDPRVLELANHIDFIRNSLDSAVLGVWERGVHREAATVSTPRGNALLVSDPANTAIRGEFRRLHEDVARYRYATGTFQRTAPTQTVNMTQHVHAAPGMNVEQLAKKAADYACKQVAEKMLDCYKHDLQNGNPYSPVT